MNDAWRLTFINNANACLLFIPFVVYFEGAMLREVSVSLVLCWCYLLYAYLSLNWHSMRDEPFCSFSEGLLLLLVVFAVDRAVHCASRLAGTPARVSCSSCCGALSS